MIRSSFGFTMVEVMIVLLILGIVSAVAVPALNNTMDEMKLDGAAREVVSAIQYTQSLSVKEGKPFEVTFYLGQERMRCRDASTTLVVLHPVYKKPFEIYFTQKGHLQGVDIVTTTFSGHKVGFNDLGEPDNVGSIILGYAGLQRTINVAAPLGRVTVN